MSLVEALQADRRLIVLRALDETPGFGLNEGTLKIVLGQFGHRVGGDEVRADMTWLEQHGLVRLEKIQAQRGELWIAHLLEPGQAVANGRPYPGVARPEPA